MRVITWEALFQKGLKTVLKLEVKAQLYEFLRQRVIHQSNILTAYIVQQEEQWVVVTPYRTEKGTLSRKELPCWHHEEIAFLGRGVASRRSCVF